jgi:hypothetical protein
VTLPSTVSPGLYLPSASVQGSVLELLEAEGDAVLDEVELEDLDLELVAFLEHLLGVVDTGVAHVGDVEQAVDAAEVDEGAKVGEAADDALANLAFLELELELFAFFLALLLEHAAARQHEVLALAIDLGDFALEPLVHEAAEILVADEVDLAHGHEAAGAVDAELEAADVAAGDAGLDDFTDAQLVKVGVGDGLAQGEAHQAGFPVEAVGDEVDALPDVGWLVGLKFVDRDDAFALAADVDEDVFGRDANDGAGDAAVVVGLGWGGFAGGEAGEIVAGDITDLSIHLAFQLRVIQFVGVDRHSYTVLARREEIPPSRMSYRKLAAE